MIDLPLYAGFVATVALLILMPGPMVALIVSNSVAYGARYGVFTVLGALPAMVLHMVVIVLGMSQALGALGHWFEVVRWCGVAYLLWLGLQAWRSPPADLTKVQAQPKSVREILLRGFLVQVSNPKTLVFYGAFFPQFISPARPLLPQLLLLCVTFVVIATTLDSAWALMAGQARYALARHGTLRNRISGGLLMGAGVGLALVRGK